MRGRKRVKVRRSFFMGCGLIFLEVVFDAFFFGEGKDGAFGGLQPFIDGVGSGYNLNSLIRGYG